MFPRTRFWCLSLAATLLAVVGSAGTASAGWVTVQNDTGRIIVVQGTVHIHGQPKRHKPVRMLPGERFREFHNSPSLQLEIFDGTNPSRPLFAGPVPIASENQAYSVAATGRGIQVVPARGK
jgi:hypothetical protein